ncbi:hypothetical protein PCASD_10630 [Puccinia coronata f. sp. avenae]|uniref:Uncharacterized protein n=1 Tax=Puccinia coronata f. sp. avenae TaxID=200324 RepID=A0A2N5TE92_9BASI|nr:hypothetical protein PCASD_10630 [Puccinia coronata f. sp. avenae]
MSPGVLSHSSLAICNSHGDLGSHRCQGNFAHWTLTATRSHQPTDIKGPMLVYAFVRLAQTQRVGPPICQAGTNPAGRSTYSRSWYQPSKQVYLLAKLVPAQRAGLPSRPAGVPAQRAGLLARQAGTSPAGRSNCQRAGLPARRAGTSPAGRSTCQRAGLPASGQVYLPAGRSTCQRAGLPARQLVPAQRAGLTAFNAGASLAGSPRWCQPSGLATLVPA